MLVTDTTCVCLGVGIKFFHIIYLNVYCITSHFLLRPDYLHATCIGTKWQVWDRRETRTVPAGQRPLGIPRHVRGLSRNSRIEAIVKYTTPNKRMWKLPTSTQLHATWHTYLLDMVVLPSTGASRYHKCCKDGGTSPEYFGCILV
jgi:hypothetical protein